MTSSSPQAHGAGKLILFGEHAVVYGVPALVAGLPRGATALLTPSTSGAPTLTLRRSGASRPLAVATRGGPEPLDHAWSALLDCFALDPAPSALVDLELPVGSGLGSSAAMAAAVARALAAHSGSPDPNLIRRAVDASEQVFHGNPSGIDAAAALEPRVLRFCRELKGPAIESLTLGRALELAVAVAGPPSSTAEVVADVAALRRRHPAVLDATLTTIDALVTEATAALACGDLEALGELASINHGLLYALGVSTPGIERARDAAMQAGALGAKLTGSGGGGCIFAIAAPGHTDSILAAWRAMSLECFGVTLEPTET